MATPTRTGRQAGTSRGRFARPTPARTGRTSVPGRGRYARTTSTPRRFKPTQGLRRRQPQQSGLKKAMSAVLPTGAAKKATPSSKKGKAGGFALIAAAAGMAFKNRGKIGELRRKQMGDSSTTPTSDSSTTPTSTDNATTPPTTPGV
jgi:hypothetical protein